MHKKIDNMSNNDRRGDQGRHGDDGPPANHPVSAMAFASIPQGPQKYVIFGVAVLFSLYFLNTYGDNPTTDYVGDYQMFDNIESFPDTNNHIDFKNGQLNYRTFIYNLYYQHFFKNGRILIGQYDLNMDFAFSNVGLNFINSSFGVQPTLTYNVPSFSTFPFTNLTTRIEYNLNKYTVRAAIAQGMGGNNLTNPHGAKYRETFKEGVMFMIAEINRAKISSDYLMSDFKLGFWGHSGSKSMKFHNVTDTLDTKCHFNFGAYFIAD